MTKQVHLYSDVTSPKELASFPVRYSHKFLLAECRDFYPQQFFWKTLKSLNESEAVAIVLLFEYEC